MAISSIVLQAGWQYAPVLFERFAKEWDREGLTSRILVTFETEV
jgi:hypothetical protein